MPLLAVLNGCISGEIGTGTDMFENNISLRAYELNEEEEWEEKDCDSSGMTIETVIGSDMIYNTYSSIGLKLANNSVQNSSGTEFISKFVSLAEDVSSARASGNPPSV